MEDVEKKAEQQEAEEKKVEEKKNEQEAKDAAYWQQQAQQYDANARREKLAREDNEKAAGDTKAQLTQTNLKLTELQQKLEQKSQYKEMNEEVDPAVASNIEALQKQIEGLVTTQSAQQAKITQYEQNEATREQTRQYDEAVEQICLPLDEKYGQKYRSEARALADKAVDDGSENKPQTTLQAYLLHEKFYKQLSEKKVEKKTTTTDNGKGTVTVAAGRDKPGSFDDVLAEMKAKAKN